MLRAYIQLFEPYKIPMKNLIYTCNIININLLSHNYHKLEHVYNSCIIIDADYLLWKYITGTTNSFLVVI